jgi:mono/diheme cytochrome c family protein
MNYRILFVPLFLICMTSFTCAQTQGHDNSLSEQQKLGQRIFQQRCSICHTQAMIISKPYGPLLNKELIQGRESSVRTTIMEGETGLMPGFRYGMEPSEIDAIIEYLETVDKPAQPIVNWVAEH